MNPDIDSLSPFSRQIPLLGEAGQDRLRNSALLIAGLGGLGSVVAQQLVRLGIGTLYLVDRGLVDLPDLNRQMLYSRDDLGLAKSHLTAERLDRLGLGCRLIPIKENIQEGFHLPGRIDGIVDCLDNLPARYILDDLARDSSLFLIHGAVHGFIGQATTIIPGRSRSLRQLFDNQLPPLETIPVSAQIPGIIASVQVREIIGLLCGLECSLLNRMLWIDLLNYRFEIVDLSVF